MDTNLVKHLLFTSGKYDARRSTNTSKMPGFSALPGNTTSEKVWLLFHKRPLCHCGKPTKFLNYTQGYRKYCSRTCIQTSPLELFERRDHHKKLWSSDQWKEQTSQRMKEAHFRSRTPKKLAALAEKGIVPLDELKPGQANIYRWKHTCGEIFTRSFARVAGIYCPVCHVSQGQGELFEEIKRRYAGEIIVNDRQVIAPKEIDIYLPALKLGFEFNGKYWHPGDRRREKKKSVECKSAHIKLIHVWEQEWKKDRSKILRQLDKLLRPSCR